MSVTEKEFEDKIEASLLAGGYLRSVSSNFDRVLGLDTAELFAFIGVAWEADVTERLDTIEYRTTINDYMTAEVHPYVPDAWVDFDKTKIGYEITLTRHFYTYTPPRPLAEIDAEIKQLETEIQELLREVAE